MVGTIPASLLLKWKLFLNGRVLRGRAEVFTGSSRPDRCR